MRTVLLAVAVCCALSTSAPSLLASDPKAVALNAVATLFVQHDVAGFRAFVSPTAIQGDRDSGSALTKIDKQRPEQMKAIELSQVIFFRAPDIDRLEKRFPDDLWPRVKKHIGENQGVLIKLALTGAVAERARSAGKDPNDIAMMTWILNSDSEPNIIHVDDN